jgi:hypothetical protein
MTDKAPHVLPKSSRDPVDRISHAMLKRPIRTLTPPELAMIRRALKGPRRAELLGRWAALKGVKLDPEQ